MWFKTVTTTPSKVILKSTGQALPGLPGPRSEKISDWSTVSPGGEAPFEFTSGEKLRHRVSGYVNQKFYKKFTKDVQQGNFPFPLFQWPLYNLLDKNSCTLPPVFFRCRAFRHKLCILVRQNGYVGVRNNSFVTEFIKVVHEIIYSWLVYDYILSI